MLEVRKGFPSGKHLFFTMGSRGILGQKIDLPKPFFIYIIFFLGRCGEWRDADDIGNFVGKGGGGLFHVSKVFEVFFL